MIAMSAIMNQGHMFFKIIFLDRHNVWQSQDPCLANLSKICYMIRDVSSLWKYKCQIMYRCLIFYY